MYQFNKDLIHISVDSGKGGTKYCYLNQKSELATDVIITKIESASPNEEIKGSCDDVILDLGNDETKRYFVGDREGNVVIDSDSTKLMEKHEICIYTAIARVLTQHLDLELTQEVETEKGKKMELITHKISLTVNVPLHEFRDTLTKQKYVKKYENKEITLTINKNKVKFHIVNASVFYESQGAIIRNNQLINQNDEMHNVLVVDCGSRNDTHVLFNNKIVPVKGKNTVGRAGIHSELAKFASELSVRTGDDFTVGLIESVLVGKTTLKNITRDELIEQFAPYALDVAKDILRTTKTLQVSKNNTDILFTGGASVVLRKQLQEVYELDGGDDKKNGYSVYFSADPRFDNCKGALIKELSKLVS